MQWHCLFLVLGWYTYQCVVSGVDDKSIVGEWSTAKINNRLSINGMPNLEK